jgi:hypothetical protein
MKKIIAFLTLATLFLSLTAHAIEITPLNQQQVQENSQALAAIQGIMTSITSKLDSMPDKAYIDAAFYQLDKRITFLFEQNYGQSVIMWLVIIIVNDILLFAIILILKAQGRF